MKCPKCGEKTKVKDIVHAPEKTYRKLQCLACGYVFYTAENEVEMTKKDRFKWNLHYRKKKGSEDET